MTDHAHLILYYILDQIKQSDMFDRIFIIVCIYEDPLPDPKIICQVKTLIVKFRLLSRKLQSLAFHIFPLIDIVSNIDYHFFGNLSNVIGTNLTTVLLEKLGWKFWVWIFYKNIKDTFNECIPYITHFAAFHLFLRRSQILWTFIRHLTSIKSNISKTSRLLFQIEFK